MASVSERSSRTTRLKWDAKTAYCTLCVTSVFADQVASGIGREHGIAGFEEYLETKTLGLPVTA